MKDENVTAIETLKIERLSSSAKTQNWIFCARYSVSCLLRHPRDYDYY